HTKLVRRHPHVFGETKAANVDEALQSWHKIKQAERGVTYESAMDDVPAGLPALLQAKEIQKIAAKVGFDWPAAGPVFEKLREELKEFERARDEASLSDLQEELGDLFFTLVNLSRHYKIDPETELRCANTKFLERFRHMERSAQEKGRKLDDLSPDQLEELWAAAKQSTS
ncbi:MAG: MazG family protein, partial [Candidatus Omnitrophica bacterium]|nr:MazG family protein [Candidatus Omnitrophota bacterium]